MTTTLLPSAYYRVRGLLFGRFSLRRRLRDQGRELAAGVVQPDEERAGLGVGDDRGGGGVDDDPLEGVQVLTEGIGDDRLDHVTVRNGYPDRVVGQRRVVRADRVYPA